MDRAKCSLHVVCAGKKRKKLRKIDADKETHCKLSIFITDVITISSSLDEEKTRS